MIWRAGLSALPTEIIPGVSASKIETEVYVTDKATIDKLPIKEKVKKTPAGPKKTGPRPSSGYGQQKVAPPVPKEESPVKKSAVNIGESFKSLKPEVQTTLDKIFSQVELVSHTLHLLEKRIAYSEDRMSEVMNFIKDGDVQVRPRLVPGYPQFHNFSAHTEEFSEQLGYIVRPQMENLNINTGPVGTQSDSPMSAQKYNEGGEEYFRNTNVFESQSQ